MTAFLYPNLYTQKALNMFQCTEHGTNGWKWEGLHLSSLPVTHWGIFVLPAPIILGSAGFDPRRAHFCQRIIEL